MRAVVCPGCGKNTNVNISETGGRTRTKCLHCKREIVVDTNREGKIESVFTTSACFIATACASATVSPERCAEELSILRRYRDSYLQNLPTGDVFLSDYYRDAPKIVRAIQAERNSSEILKRLHEEYIVPAIKLILASKDNDAFDLYNTLIKVLRQNYLKSEDTAESGTRGFSPSPHAARHGGSH